MQRTLRGKVYDTDTATLVAHRAKGQYGDPEGYEEKLCMTPDGLYFLYGIGGNASPYPTPTLRAVSKQRAGEMEKEMSNE